MPCREVLGEHVEQKGSLVEPDILRFDFSHFQKMSDEEIREVEHRVNRMIRQNSAREEHRSLPMSKAREMGAMALFGEKYGDAVRVIRFGDSVELCGGTHVEATGQIGIFRIFRESSIAAGIRRIEAFTGEVAERYIDEHMDMVRQIAATFEKQKDLVKAVKGVVEENSKLAKQVERFQKNMLGVIARNLENKLERMGDSWPDHVPGRAGQSLPAQGPGLPDPFQVSQPEPGAGRRDRREGPPGHHAFRSDHQRLPA